jgi:hypothetical protein
MQEEHTEVIETPQASTTREARTTNATPYVTDVRSSTAPRTDVDRVESVTYDPYEGRRMAAYRLTQLIYWVFGLIEGLIVIRLVLKALAANPSAGFAQFVYGITVPLVGPFVGLFSNPAYQNSVLELSSIVALIVYALAAWLLGKLVWILLGETRTAIHARSTHLDSRT